MHNVENKSAEEKIMKIKMRRILKCLGLATLITISGSGAFIACAIGFIYITVKFPIYLIGIIFLIGISSITWVLYNK